MPRQSHQEQSPQALLFSLESFAFTLSTEIFRTELIYFDTARKCPRYTNAFSAVYQYMYRYLFKAYNYGISDSLNVTLDSLFD